MGSVEAVRALLDLHVLIRWFSECPRLPSAHQQVFAAVSPEAPLVMRDISLCGVALLHGSGQISLAMPLREWLDRATSAPLVRLGS